MGKQYDCELCQDRGSLPDFSGPGSVRCDCRVQKEKRFIVVCYMRVVPEDLELMTKDQARVEIEQLRLMQPENIYRIEDVEDVVS